jgi:hypothetical protein
MKRLICVGAVLTLAGCTTPEPQVVSLAAGVKILLADGTPLEVGTIGHAAPVYHDFDKDGVPDLVVGEYEDGACRIFRNYGTATNPVFRDFEFFHAGGKKASVPPD